jgi:PAS domain S-box-containing protein
VPARYEFRWRRKDGSACWVEIYASRIEYHGRPAIQTAYIDITERKKAEEALKENEEKYRSLIVNIPDVVWTTDQNGQTTFISSNIEEIYGYTPEEIYEEAERLWFGRIHPDDVERVSKAFEAVFEREVQLDIEYRIQRKDGEWIWLHDRSIGAYEKNGIKHADGVFSDITGRKQMEERVAKSRELFSKVFYVNPVPATITTVSNDKLLMVNDAWLKLIGFDSQEEAIGKSAVDLGLWADIEDRAERNTNLQESGYSGIQEMRVHTPSGRIRDCLYTAEMIEYEGQPHILSMAIDITERKKAEEALRVERDKLQALMDGINRAGIGIDIIGADYEVLFQNKILEEESGDLRGKCCYEHYMAREEPCDQCPAMRAIKEKKTINVEHRGLDERDYQVFSAPLPDTDGTVSKAIEIVIEITERKNAQQKLLDYQRQLKSLASELLLAEERERRRIATGVHDDIGQKLALAKLELQSIQATVSEPDVSASLGHACELIDNGIQDSRSLAFDLSNPVLYEVGFTAAVESLLTERMMQKSGIKTELESKIPKLNLGQDMSIVLFQAVRELLTNVVKHANANKVKVCIDKSDKRVQVIVEDDGAGFELSGLKSPDKKKGGFGLFNVKERLEYLGGSFDIESKPGQGTRVMMTIPLESGITAS